MRGVSLVLGLLCAACAGVEHEMKTYGKRPDVSVPTNETKQVSFAPLVQQRVVSNSFYSRTKEANLMDRVLLGPNLVFESSRSSLKEPNVVPPGAPPQDKAIGDGVHFPHSAVLMSYLATEHNSKVLAPVLTRRFSCDWWWNGCPEMTWMERLMMLSQSPSSTTTKEGGKETTVTWGGRNVLTADVPTVAMAVRQLGINSRRFAVTVQMNAKGDIEFKPRADPHEPSLCEASLTVDVPMITFQAEFVSMKDGQILARIDEERSPSVTLDTRRVVPSVSYTPVTDTGFTIYRDGEPYDGKYTYVKAFETRNELCSNSLRAFGEVSTELQRILLAQVKPALTDLFRVTMDPLYAK
jgi:hypothetical protein